MDDSRQQQVLSDLVEFVRIPSRSNAEGGEEGRLQSLIAEKMGATGARVRTFEVDDLPDARSHPLFCGPQRDYRNRPTVIGELGPADAPALLVLAHSDTVPLYAPERWTVDPFAGVTRDGTLTGLGAGDDKWGLAVMLSAMRSVARRTVSLRKRIVFASTIDEENGVGNGVLLLHLAGVKAEAAMYLDGCDFELCIGNCGGSNFYLRPKQPLDRSAMDRHVIALERLAADLSTEREKRFEVHPMFRANRKRHASVGYATRTDSRGPFHLVFFYTLPKESRDVFCAELEKRIAQTLGNELALYATSYREPWFEPSCDDPENHFVRLVADTQRAVLGSEPCITTMPKQDAFVLRNHAIIPTVSFGIGRSDGPGAQHSPDETITLDSLWAAHALAQRVIERWLDGN